LDKPAPALPPEKKEQRKRHKREEEEHKKKPQMETHPGEVSAKSVKAVEIMRVEAEKRALEAAMAYQFDVYLGRDQDKDSKNQGDEQPFESFADVLACIPESQCKPGALSGKDKENGHDPLHQDPDKNREPKTRLEVLDMPIFVVKKPRTVEQKDRKHGEDSQPVNIMTSLMGGHR